MSDTTEPVFRSDVTVELVKGGASDADVIWAARVSTAGEKSLEELEADPARSEGLIRYLLVNRHGTPFEHAGPMTFFIQAPIYVFREFMRHRIGFCLAGDTEVWLETYAEKSGRTIRRRTIESLYTNWHEGVTDSMGRVRLLPACRNITVRTLDEETGQFILSRVVDIYRNGVKPVVKVTTDTGETIRATLDHAVWTPDGWAKIGELGVGSLIGRNGKVALGAGRQYPPALRNGIGVWTSMQRETRVLPVDFCRSCGGVFSREELELDHIVPVVVDIKLALDVNNLAPLCVSCHREKTNTEQSLATRPVMTAGVKFTRIVSIEPDGETETYDLELEGPSRGFVANGLVVHNSYNEESGRYRELSPVFYVPGPDRALVQIGKTGHYQFEAGTAEQHAIVDEATKEACSTAYAAYQRMLDAGVAREVARGVLPVATFSSMYATCNARSLMSFLSLRVHAEGSKFPSFPQREIEMVAEQMEAEFARMMPLTYKAFIEGGRVSP